VAEHAIRTEGLSKRYRIGGGAERYKTLRESLQRAAHHGFRPSQRRSARERREVWALRDVSLDIERGRIMGIVGPNGAGKTTLLKILSRITEPTQGSAEISGRVGSLLEVGTGFHPELTGRENIYLNGAVLGMTRREITQRFDDIVEFAEVARFIDTPLKRYSTGMQTRLAFSVAAHIETEVLLVDEVLAVGDASFQRKCLSKMGDVAQEGRTVLFVSHNMGAIRSLCDSAVMLNAGRLMKTGPTADVISSYYTALGIIDSSVGQEGEIISGAAFGSIGIPGEVVQQAEEFEVRTQLHIDRPLSGVALYCILEDSRGTMVFHLREDRTGRDGEVIRPGAYRVGLKLPALWLNPGLYSLYFKALFRGEYGNSRHVSNKVPLDVDGASSAVQSVLHPRAAWSFQAEG
jgi:lipopolysaccharide transport system ATP-binding protein